MSVGPGIGLIGAGRAAERLHLPALRRSGAGRLVAVADPDRGRREALARRGRARSAFATAEELLRERSVEAVLVASPPETHAGVVRAAIEARKPVLVEKPLAMTVEEARDLERRARAAGVPLVVALNRRHLAAARTLRRRVAERHAGEPPEVEGEISSDRASWDAVSGDRDLLDDLAPHPLDLVRFVTDRPLVAIAATRPSPSEVRLDCRLAGGGRARFRLLLATDWREFLEVRYVERRYRLSADSDRLEPPDGVRRSAADLGARLVRKAVRRSSPMTRSYERQIEAFVAVVRGRAPAAPDASDGVALARAVEAARRSIAAGGAEIELDHGTTGMEEQP